jgi:hypothetical protein
VPSEIEGLVQGFGKWYCRSLWRSDINLSGANKPAGGDLVMLSFKATAKAAFGTAVFVLCFAESAECRAQRVSFSSSGCSGASTLV